ncbi:hypothetical protein [Amycolatopsis anabasis]|uniref:hypothetical protein n=1 Tax=Amycolatopsis anabasis TaxID=1840409 RepID=UPI00131AD290|nr:hypothetical protein [Amycolatopsis anabasis]
MPTWLLVVIILIAIAVLGAVTWLVTLELQRKRLRDRFGPEYERTVRDRDSRRDAERELAAREKRHAELDIRPLSPSAHERYAQRWALIQEQFVDRPARAVAEADRVLVELMAERGYPTEGYDQQLADLSVQHARTLEHYRSAHETMRNHEHTEASTEKLRDAMVRYRTVFEDLLADGAEPGDHDRRDARARRTPESRS